MSPFIKGLAGALALAIGGTGAHADVLGFGTSNGTPLAHTERAVPLRSNGATSVTFTTKRENTIVVVTYNASCKAALGEHGSYVSLRIVVDGIGTEPQAGPSFVFCTQVDPDRTASFRVSRQAFIKVPRAGQHSVQVFASLQLATTGSLFQSSIVIQN